MNTVLKTTVEKPERKFEEEKEDEGRERENGNERSKSVLEDRE